MSVLRIKDNDGSWKQIPIISPALPEEDKIKIKDALSEELYEKINSEIVATNVEYQRELASEIDGKIATAQNPLKDKINRNTEDIAINNERIDKISDDVKGRTVTIQRIFRYVSVSAEQKSHGQCIVHTPYNTLVSGGNSDNVVQTICETDMDGNLLEGRFVQYNDEGLRHLNDMALHNGKLYCIGGVYVVVIDYATLQIEKSVRLGENDLSIESLYGIHVDEQGNVIVLGAPANDIYRPVISYFNMEEGSLTKICQFDEPIPTNNFKPVKQAFTIKDGYAYCFYNYDNHIVKVNLENGEVVSIYDIPNGDGYYPTGEVENGLFIGDQLYIYSSMYQFGRRTKFFNQLFKTNIGGETFSASQHGQSEENYVNIYVDGNSTENNPTGYTTSPFSSLEEACMVFHYRQRITDTDKAGIWVLGGQENLAGEYCFLFNTSAYLVLGGAEVARLELRNVDGMAQGVKTDAVVLSCCNIIMPNAEIGDLYSIGSDIKISGSISTISKLERTKLEFLQSIYSSYMDEEGVVHEETINNIEITSFNTSKIVGSTGRYNYNGVNVTPHTTEGTDKYSTPVPLTPMHLKKFQSLNGYDIVYIKTRVIVSGASCDVSFRMPSAFLLRLNQGETISASATGLVFSPAQNSFVGFMVKCSINLSEGIKFSVTKSRNLSTNEYWRGTYYFYEITFENSGVDTL